METNPGFSDVQARSKRPFSVTILALGVLTIAGLNLLRSVQTILHWEFLSGLISVPSLYLLLSGLFWTLAGVTVGIGLWLGLAWAPRFTLAFALIYTIYFWIDRLIISPNKMRKNDPFIAIVNILLLLITWWILSRRNTRSYFGDLHER